jgi:uncharacterized RDD family membrane protein YckC
MYPDPNQPQPRPDGPPSYQQPAEQSSWQQPASGPYGQQQYQQQYQQPYGQQQYQQPYQQAYGQPQLQYVGVGWRFLALLIDAIILGIVLGIISSIFRNAAGVVGLLDFIITFGYFIVMEATRGATIGKMALGLRVVKTNGAPISWSESVIRNLLRIIDGLFAYLVGAIFIWTSPLKQRLGDRAANTVVVKRSS